MCDLACSEDGWCNALCAAADFCSFDEDCFLALEGEDLLRLRSLQSLSQSFSRGFKICCWTSVVVGTLCGFVCFLMCMNVDYREKIPIVRDYNGSWANPLSYRSSTNSKASEEEETDNNSEKTQELEAVGDKVMEPSEI